MADCDVIVTDCENEVLVLTNEDTVVVTECVGAPGPQGEPGEPGPTGPAGGGYVFIHTQVAPAATWIINHNAGRPVHVTLYNSAGSIIHADVVASTINVTTVTFPYPVVGTAFIS
jgi:hypothetical protein